MENGDHLRRAGRLMRRAAIASVAVSLFLVTIKTFAYFASHSVAMLASMADSALDLFTSSLNLFAIRQALTPADAEHRFGHGKAEPLAGLAQGAFITASALFLVIQAVRPHPGARAAGSQRRGADGDVRRDSLRHPLDPLSAAGGGQDRQRGGGSRPDPLYRRPRHQYRRGAGAGADGLSGLDPGRSADRHRGGGHHALYRLRRRPPELASADGPRTAGRGTRPHPPHRRGP